MFKLGALLNLLLFLSILIIDIPTLKPAGGGMGSSILPLGLPYCYPGLCILKDSHEAPGHWTEKQKGQYFSSNDCPNKYSFDQPVQLLFDPFILPDRPSLLAPYSVHLSFQIKKYQILEAYLSLPEHPPRESV